MLSACRGASAWRAAVALLRQMGCSGNVPAPRVQHYGAVAACLEESLRGCVGKRNIDCGEHDGTVVGCR